MAGETANRPETLEIFSALLLAEWLALGPKRYADSLGTLERIARWLAPITDEANVQRVFNGADGYTKMFLSLMAGQARSAVQSQIRQLRLGAGYQGWNYNVSLFRPTIPFLRVLNGEVAPGESPEVSNVERASKLGALVWSAAAVAALAAPFLPAVVVATGEMLIGGAEAAAAASFRVAGQLLVKAAPGALAWVLQINVQNPQLILAVSEWTIGTILTIKTSVRSLEDLRAVFSDPQFAIQLAYDLLTIRVIAANRPRLTRPARITQIDGGEIKIVLVEEEAPPGAVKAAKGAQAEEEIPPAPPPKPPVSPAPDPEAVIKLVPDRTPGEDAALQKLGSSDPGWTEAIAERVTPGEVETYRTGSLQRKNGIISRHQGAIQERFLLILSEFQNAWAKATGLRDDIAAKVKQSGSQVGSVERLWVSDAAGELTDGLIGAVETRADGSQRLHVFFVFEVKSTSNVGDLLRNVPKAQSFVSGQVENSRARLETNTITVHDGGEPRTFRADDVGLVAFEYEGKTVRSKWFVVAPYDARTEKGFSNLVKRLENQGRGGVDLITSPLRNATLRNLANAILSILAGD